MKKIGIYMIINKVNNKKYIGSSRNLTQRRRSHLYKLRHGKHENNHLQNAFNKYGEENFKFDIIEECSIEDLAKKENENIKEWKTLLRDKGYNISPKTGNKEVSQETRNKLSILAKNRTTEHKKKLAESRRGWNPSKEIRKKMSESHMGYQMPQEQKDKISKALKGRKASKEATANMSKARKGRIITKEQKEKISRSLKGRTLTEETKEKMRIAKANISDETRKKISESGIGRRHSEESKMKMREARLKYYQNRDENANN